MHPDDLRQSQDTIFLSRKNASALLHRSDDITAIEPSDPIIPADNVITVALPESRINLKAGSIGMARPVWNEKFP